VWHFVRIVEVDVDMADFNLILAIDVGKKRCVIELEEL